MSYHLVKELTHYCNITVPGCSNISLRTIDFYDFTFVLEGSMTYYANGVPYVMHKNDAVFFPPGTVYIREKGTEPVSYVSFNFLANDHVSFPFSLFLPKCVTGNMRKLVSIFPTSHLSPLYFSKEKCTLMLEYLLYEFLDSTAPECTNEHVDRMLKYIDEHIHDKLSLQLISNELNLSKEYTSAIFKKEMQKTLTDYINERKLTLARELIVSREMTLHAVASHLGYDNYNYFCRIFKNHFGKTPGQVRKET